MSKPQFHQSALDMLHKCGEQYRRRYVEGEIVPPAIAMTVGSSVHDAARDSLQKKIDTGDLLSVDECAQLARDALVARWDYEGVGLNNDERKQGEAVVRGEAVDKVVRLSKFHAGYLAPLLKPIAVERSWVIECEGYPFDFVGIIDVEELGPVLRDLKTKGKSPSQGEADYSDQLTMYALAKYAQVGELPTAMWLDCIVDLKAGPVLKQQATIRDAVDVEIFARRLENAAKVVESGVFTPARRSDWWCGPKWCGYYDSCPYVRGRTVHTTGAAL
jgi:hypothetical protein